MTVAGRVKVELGRLRLLCRLRPHPRPILHGRMRRAETGAAGAEQFFTQRALSVGLLVAPAPGQLRHQHVGDILEIARRNRKRNVQAVDVGLLEPGLDLVGDFSGVPTTTGPMPPMPTCSATSRTVHTRSGSARVILSIAVRPASFWTWRTCWSRS